MFDLPTMEHAEQVIVDESVVTGQSEPLIIHSKKKKDSEKTTAA